MCAHEALIADHGTIQNRCAHSNQNLVADRAGMENRSMTRGYVAAQDARKLVHNMQNTVVLNVRMVADHNSVYITPRHGIIPDA